MRSITDTEKPAVWRVWWQYNSTKLIGRKPRPECRDFSREAEAVAFKESLRNHFPDCACCVQPTKACAEQEAGAMTGGPISAAVARHDVVEVATFTKTRGLRTKILPALGNKNAEFAGAFAAAPAPEPFTNLRACQAGVVLADPPWNFIAYSSKGWRKSAHAHYPCMDLAEIRAMPVADLAAPDSVLVLWSTQVHLLHAIAVLEAWGFTFKTMGAWAKQSSTARCWQFGTGYLLRSAAEFFLIGTRGRPQQLSRSSRNLIVAPVREHSRKPDAMYELVEATWPGPYVELFARYVRPGWSQWPEPTAEAGAR